MKSFFQKDNLYALVTSISSLSTDENPCFTLDVIIGITISEDMNIGNREVSSHIQAIIINEATGVAFIIDKSGDSNVSTVFDLHVRNAVRHPIARESITPVATLEKEKDVDIQKSEVLTSVHRDRITERGVGTISSTSTILAITNQTPIQKAMANALLPIE